MRIRLLLCCTPILALAQSTVPAVSATGITNIAKLLESCPSNDPAYSTIRADFQILRDDAPVGAVACAEPISLLPRPQFSQEIILLQTLRVIYYMDRGKSNYLPWTNLRMYDWMKSKIGGVNIKNTGAASAYCCDTFGGRKFVAIQDYNNIANLLWDAYRSWFGIPGLIGLLGHETRHVDGYPHVACCPQPGNCDQTYDEGNLSAVGIQNWLWRAFLNGTINVNANCLPGNNVDDFANNFLDAANRANGAAWFCDAKPPVAALPSQPGGSCPNRSLTSALTTGGIANAASYRTGAVAPGELLTIFANGIDVPALTTFQLDASGKVPSTLANTIVYVNGIRAPMIYATQNQVSAIVPYAATGRAGFTSTGAYVEIENNGVLTNYVKLPAVTAQPGFFTLDGTGKGQIAAFNEDGQSNSPQNPASRGGILVAYATGAGLTDPAGVDGQVNTPPIPVLKNAVRVTVQGKDAPVLYAGPAPGLVSGVIQVNFRIPPDAVPGSTASVALIVGAFSSIGATFFAIR